MSFNVTESERIKDMSKRNSEVLRDPKNYATASLNGKRRRLTRYVSMHETNTSVHDTDEYKRHVSALQAIERELARREAIAKSQNATLSDVVSTDVPKTTTKTTRTSSKTASK